MDKDLDIAKDLSQLQARKLAIETGTDLTHHCATLVEFDTRVGDLLTEVRTLHADLEQRFGIMGNKWDQLGPSYQTLLVTDQVLDLVIGIKKLNKICRRLETNPNLVRSEDGHKIGLKFLARINCDSENIDLEGDDKSTILTVYELLESFECAYRPFEEILSKRNDLPYVNYATKVRALKESISKLRVLQHHQE